jgi:chromosome segregation ATPase
VNRALDFSRLLVYVALVALLWTLTAATIEIRSDAQQLTAKASGTLTDASRAMQDLVGTTAEVRKTLKAMQASEEQTAANSAAATATLNADLVQVGGLLHHADQALTEVELDQDRLRDRAAALELKLDGGIDAGTEAFTQLSMDLSELEPSLLNLNDATAGAAKTANDPAMRQTIENVAGVTADLHAETGLLVDTTRTALAPKNKTLSLLKSFAGGTVTAAELWYYFTHVR